ncbi:MAG: BON domain-containing protein [Oscillatoriales cyanobacterium]|nr:MAG: BON domain-containing protein [Oscillatoriales cyanobacterium]
MADPSASNSGAADDGLDWLSLIGDMLLVPGQSAAESASQPAPESAAVPVVADRSTVELPVPELPPAPASPAVAVATSEPPLLAIDPLSTSSQPELSQPELSQPISTDSAVVASVASTPAARSRRRTNRTAPDPPSTANDAWDQLQNLLVGDVASQLETRVDRLRSEVTCLQEQVEPLDRLLQSPETLVNFLSPVLSQEIERQVRGAEQEIVESLETVLAQALPGEDVQLRKHIDQMRKILHEPDELTRVLAPSLAHRLESFTDDLLQSADQGAGDGVNILQRQIDYVQVMLRDPDMLVELLSPAIVSTTQKRVEDVEREITSVVSPAVEMLRSDFLARFSTLQHQVQQIHYLLHDADSLVELLSPLIARLIERRVVEAREEICQALLPTIDRIILERSLQDRQAMAEAIAPVLDAAIISRMQEQPEALAQAISRAVAPETAAAMREQYRLDSMSMVEALGPMMGASIKQQIVVERDAMVDALYPVIGNTIAKYMKDAIESINEKVQNTLSVEGVSRKLRARMQGVSEAELILREAMPYRVRAVFLIHKASGLVMSEAQFSEQEPLEGDMLAGMLTAIRSFVSDCIVQSESVSELHEIQYNDSQIAMEVAGYCYLAVIVQGEPSKALYRHLRSTLVRLVERYDRPIQSFDGDPSALPQAIHLAVAALVRQTIGPQQQQARPAGFPWALAGLITGLVLAIALPWTWFRYQAQRDRTLMTAIETALSTSPQLAVYDLSVQLTGDRLSLQGKVPYPWLRFQAERTAMQTYRATDPSRFQQAPPPNNQIIAVQLPNDPVLAAAEVARVSETLNRNGNRVGASYSIDSQAGGTATIAGSVRSRAESSAIASAFSQIPGIARVVNSLQIVIPSLTVRLYFELGADRFVDVDLAGKIEPIREFLQRYPDLNLRVVGHSLTTEPNGAGLALLRAQSVRSALVSRGIQAQRLTIGSQTGPPPDVTRDDPDWMGRCVRFEAIAAP